MKASGKRIGGYEKTGKPRRNTPAKKLRQATKDEVGEAKGREALNMMFAAMCEILEAQRRAYAGEKDVNEHAEAMRKLLRYVQRKMKMTGGLTGTVRPRRRGNDRA